MSIFDRIVNGIIRFAQRRPYIHLEGYMNRWWILPYNRTGIAARVHQILRSDEDRHFHDHPWWYISIVLRGGYFEVTPCSLHKGCEDCQRIDLYGGGWPGCTNEVRTWRGPGSIAFRKATSWHRLELDADYLQDRRRDCWTLFITGPERDDAEPGHSCWGFLVDGVKVPADVYLGDRYIDTHYQGGAA